MGGLGVKAGVFIAGISIGAAVMFFVFRPRAVPGGVAACFSKAAEAPTPVFRFQGKVYSVADLPADAARAFVTTAHDMFVRQSIVAEETATRLLLAQKGGKPEGASELASLAELASGGAISDDDVRKQFDSMRSAFPKDVRFEQVAGTVRSYMEGQRVSRAKNEALSELREKGGFTSLVAPPCLPTGPLELGKYPRSGNAGGVVNAVLFSHYGCAQCRGVETQVKRMADERARDVGFTEIYYVPENARGAENLVATASYCASRMGAPSFAAFREGMRSNFPVTLNEEFSKNGEKPVLEALSNLARSVGLDAAELTSCAASEEARKFVDNVSAYARRAGVVSGAALFANERRVGLFEDSIVSAFGVVLETLVPSPSK